MGKILSSKKHYILVFAVLLLALQGIFNYSWSYWESVSEFYYYENFNGIIRSITAAVENLFLAIVFERFLTFYKKDRERAFLLFGIMLTVSFFLVQIGFGMNANGDIICLRIFGVNAFHLRILYVGAFVLLTKGIDWLVKKHTSRFAAGYLLVYVIIMMQLCYEVSYRVLPGFCIGGIVIVYYWFKVKGKIKWIPTLAYVGSLFFQVFWGVGVPFRASYIDNTLARLQSGIVPYEFTDILLEESSFRLEELSFFAFEFPVMSVYACMGVLGVVAIFLIYAAMFVLIWNYISVHVPVALKGKYRIFWAIMLLTFCMGMLYELDVWSIILFEGLPFVQKGGFIWLAVLWFMVREKQDAPEVCENIEIY